ncbi:MAG: repair protein RadC, partial [candidate division NC10 bacterium]|nr:repair protein RadC [candidate division NC10 bacterium]
FTTDTLRTSADVARAFAFLADRDREEFWLAALDQRHRIIGTSQISIGTLTSALVHPREILKVLVLSSAAATVLVHVLCGAAHNECYVTLVLMCSTRS